MVWLLLFFIATNATESPSMPLNVSLPAASDFSNANLTNFYKIKTAIYYFPGVIGTHPLHGDDRVLADDFPSYTKQFESIHDRDLAWLSQVADTIRIAGFIPYPYTDDTYFLDKAHSFGLKIIASFSMRRYRFSSLSDQTTFQNVIDDFNDFVRHLKNHPAVVAVCLGDVDDEWSEFQRPTKTSPIQPLLTSLVKISQKTLIGVPVTIAMFYDNSEESNTLLSLFKHLQFDFWIFNAARSTVLHMNESFQTYPGGLRPALLQVSESAWNYNHNRADPAQQATFYEEMFDFISWQRSMPNQIIAPIFFEWTDQWWRAPQRTNCVFDAPYGHAPCGVVKTFAANEDSAYDAIEYNGLTFQFDRFFATHCIEARSSLLQLANFTSRTVTFDVGHSSCTQISWGKWIFSTNYGLSTLPMILVLFGSLFSGTWKCRKHIQKFTCPRPDSKNKPKNLLFWKLDEAEWKCYYESHLTVALEAVHLFCVQEEDILCVKEKSNPTLEEGEEVDFRRMSAKNLFHRLLHVYIRQHPETQPFWEDPARTFDDFQHACIVYRTIWSLAEQAAYCPSVINNIFHSLVIDPHANTINLAELHRGLDQLQTSKARRFCSFIFANQINYDDIEDAARAAVDKSAVTFRVPNPKFLTVTRDDNAITITATKDGHIFGDNLPATEPVKTSFLEFTSLFVLVDVLWHYRVILYLKFWLVASAFYVANSTFASTENMGNFKSAWETWGSFPEVFIFVEAYFRCVCEGTLLLFNCLRVVCATSPRDYKYSKKSLLTITGAVHPVVTAAIVAALVQNVKGFGVEGLLISRVIESGLGSVFRATRNKCRKASTRYFPWEWTVERTKAQIWKLLFWAIVLGASWCVEAFILFGVVRNLHLADLCKFEAQPCPDDCFLNFFCSNQCMSCTAGVFMVYLLVFLGCLLDTHLVFSLVLTGAGYLVGLREQGAANVYHADESISWEACSFKIGEAFPDIVAREKRLASRAASPVQRRRRVDDGTAPDIEVSEVKTGKHDIELPEIVEHKVEVVNDKAKVVNDKQTAPSPQQDEDKFQYMSSARVRALWWAVIKDLRDRHLISKAQQNKLRLETDASVNLRVMRLVPEAQERLLFFYHSLGRLALAEKNVTIEPLTLSITAYNETVLRTAQQLREKHGEKTELEHLVDNKPEEWNYACEQFCEENVAQGTPDDILSMFVQGDVNEQLTWKIRKWASYRQQTVARTIRGCVTYFEAVKFLMNTESLASQDGELLVAHQTYATIPAWSSSPGPALEWLERMAAIDDIFREFERFSTSMSLIFDFEYVAEDRECPYHPKDGKTPEERRLTETKTERAVREKYEDLRGRFEAFINEGRKAQWNFPCYRFSVKARYSKGKMRFVHVLPRQWQLKIKDSQGKSANQLNMLRFASGHFIQVNDANMDLWLGEAFKFPVICNMFTNKQRIPTTRIIGFREYVYTQSSGPTGKFMGQSEFVFGTIISRAMQFLGSRLHYGHPDFFDLQWAFATGGLSKASPGINTSEDIFAGFTVLLRETGKNVAVTDMLEGQKGREEVFLTATSFLSKISSGFVTMQSSRDLYRLTSRLPLFGLFGLYFGSAGFYVSNVIVDVSLYVFFLAFVLLALGGVTIHDVGDAGSSLGSEWLITAGILALPPLLFELALEYGIVNGLAKLLSGIVSVRNAIFFHVFQNKVVSSSVMATVLSGTSGWIETGRPAFFQYFGKSQSYRSYANSTYMAGTELLVLYFIYLQFTDPSGGTHPMYFPVGTAIVWLIAPVIYTPQLGDFPKLKDDLYEAFGWITRGIAKPRSVHEMNKTECFNSFWWDLNNTRSSGATAFYLTLTTILSLVMMALIYSSFIDTLNLYLPVLGMHFLTTLLWIFNDGGPVLTTVYLSAPIVSVLIIITAVNPYSNGEWWVALIMLVLLGSFIKNVVLVTAQILMLPWKGTSEGFRQGLNRYLFFASFQFYFKFAIAFFVMAVQFAISIVFWALIFAWERSMLLFSRPRATRVYPQPQFLQPQALQIHVPTSSPSPPPSPSASAFFAPVDAHTPRSSPPSTPRSLLPVSSSYLFSSPGISRNGSLTTLTPSTFALPTPWITAPTFSVPTATANTVPITTATPTMTATITATSTMATTTTADTFTTPSSTTTTFTAPTPIISIPITHIPTATTSTPPIAPTSTPPPPIATTSTPPPPIATTATTTTTATSTPTTTPPTATTTATTTSTTATTTPTPAATTAPTATTTTTTTATPPSAETATIETTSPSSLPTTTASTTTAATTTTPPPPPPATTTTTTTPAATISTTTTTTTTPTSTPTTTINATSAPVATTAPVTPNATITDTTITAIDTTTDTATTITTTTAPNATTTTASTAAAATLFSTAPIITTTATTFATDIPATTPAITHPDTSDTPVTSPTVIPTLETVTSPSTLDVVIPDDDFHIVSTIVADIATTTIATTTPTPTAPIIDNTLITTPTTTSTSATATPTITTSTITTTTTTAPVTPIIDANIDPSIPITTTTPTTALPIDTTTVSTGIVTAPASSASSSAVVSTRPTTPTSIPRPTTRRTLSPSPTHMALAEQQQQTPPTLQRWISPKASPTLALRAQQFNR